MIHPTAVIHPRATVPSSTVIGPYAVIDEHVRLGEHCVVGPHAYLTGHTTIGARNRFYFGCVIGEAPQDQKYSNAPSRLRIGDDNMFREHCTVHRSNSEATETLVGSKCLIMAGAHVGHDSALGDYVVLVNGALLAGHVTIGSQALISGNCVIHQFVRVGRLAMMQGGSAISKDLPPYCVSRDANRLSGLNSVGLRRAGLSSAERLELRRLYHQLFRRRVELLRDAIEQARQQFSSEHARLLLDFVAAAKRGLCADHSKTPATGQEE